MCACMVFGSAFAQTINSELTKKDYRNISKSNPVVSPPSTSSAATVIWQNTCSDILDWSLTNSGVPPLDWNFTNITDIQSQCVTSLPANLQTFNSTTASDGFMIINSDAAPGNADANGTPIVAEFTNAIPIDLTGWPYVQLSFQHSFRWWQDTRGVRVSGDNGISWTEFEITDNAGYSTPDQNSDNPHVSTYNISSIAGDSSQVLIQFYYNDNDFWGWYWNVDDIVISEIPDNAMDISDAVQGGWWVNYANAGGDGYDYTFKPLSQLSANPYSFEAVLKNAGIAPQNTYLNAEVIDGSGSSVYSDVSSTLLLDLSHTQDTFATNSTFSPSITDTYTVNIWGTGDSTSSSISTLTTSVTDYVYGRDNNTPEGNWRVGRFCGGMILGVKYDMYVDETLYTIQTHIDAESVVGSSIYAVLFEDDPNGDPIYLTQTDDYVLTDSDLGNWVSIPFDGGESLYAATGYLAAIGGYANPVDTFMVSVSGASQGSCYIQDNGCDIGSSGYGAWYTISDVPMIRMNFDPASVGIENNLFVGSFNVHPNPNNGVFTIELNNVKSDDYIISVLNVLGQQVYTSTKEISTISSERIDLSDLGKGIYILEVSNSESTISEKIIIE